MRDASLFKWRHFQADIILCAVRWYLRYALSYRDVEELLRERGARVDHTTVFRWVQRYAPELEKRCRPLLKATNDSYRVDETYIKIKKRWYYLYRAVDSTGATLDFMLSATRDADAAERFFRQVLQASHTLTPRVITVDQNAASPPRFRGSSAGGNAPGALCAEAVQIFEQCGGTGSSLRKMPGEPWVRVWSVRHRAADDPGL
jgi:transposase, IS6 family